MALKLVIDAPRVGMVFWVTRYSLQAEVIGDRLTVPPVLTRLTKTVSVACEIWLAVMPAGSEVRSNCTSDVLPLPT